MGRFKKKKKKRKKIKKKIRSKSDENFFSLNMLYTFPVEQAHSDLSRFLFQKIEFFQVEKESLSSAFFVVYFSSSSVQSIFISNEIEKREVIDWKKRTNYKRTIRNDPTSAGIYCDIVTYKNRSSRDTRKKSNNRGIIDKAKNLRFSWMLHGCVTGPFCKIHTKNTKMRTRSLNIQRPHTSLGL